jgi:16S rRNA (guanine527-N7)-methyltransferase
VNDSAEFLRILNANVGSELTPEQIERIVEFREAVLQENEVQNLTRQTAPQDFFDGHVMDVIHLERSGLLSLPALDLGAGMGVPGVLHALIFQPKSEKTWISCDSEQKKAEFSQRMVDFFGLRGVRSVSIRGEEVLATQSVDTVVSRAVGSVTKLYGWLRTRSTWNNLVLLKGPRWDEEWREFQSSPHQGRLIVDKIYEYEVGDQGKRLKIVRLRRK